jgi:diacylglycerol kinase family enzyme
LISVAALRTYKSREYTVTSPAGRRLVRAVIVTAANSAEFGNGACIAPGARVDDGRIDLVIVEEQSRLRTILNLPRLFNGTVRRVPGCSIVQLDRATIESDQPMAFHVDGEPVQGGTSLRLRVHPGALYMCV